MFAVAHCCINNQVIHAGYPHMEIRSILQPVTLAECFCSPDTNILYVLFNYLSNDVLANYSQKYCINIEFVVDLYGLYRQIPQIYADKRQKEKK